MIPDNHLGYGVPIGGAIACRNTIGPAGVRYDIGCGNKAVRVDMNGADLLLNIGRFMDEISDTISFGVGCRNPEGVDRAVLDEAQDGWKLEATRSPHRKAGAQLGTVGSDNHYVDIFTNEDDRVWTGVHFGSGGFGHGVASRFFKTAGAGDGMDVEPCVLVVNSDLGSQYLLAAQLAGAYAYAGRD